ncbi:hypothetical protein H5410_057248 [Solanum commersonii]|uniref:Uncharacterized protein n=1 Tax=Solanum commersonii TaxID=4109 RepID=A0A9J5WNI5_SOLCO|nr:hypothetical protein H5410_057248 [Solanum commersonii]
MDVIITKYVKGSKWCINLVRKQYGLSVWKCIRRLRDEFNDKCRLKVVSACNTEKQLDRWLDDLPLKEVSKCGSSNTPVLSKLMDAKIDSEEEEEACLPQSHLGVGKNDTDEEIDNSVNDKDDQVDPHLAKVIQFKRQTVLRSRMFTGYGGLEMGELLAKIVVQGWSNMFLQGDHRRKLCKA